MRPSSLVLRHFAAIRSFATRNISKSERGKQLAAYRAVDEMLDSSLEKGIVGLGSGSTIEHAIERIHQRKDLDSVVYVPTSFQTRQLILHYNLRLGSIDQYTSVDLTIDGADEVDRDLNAIKGGGACLFQERLVAQASKKFVLIADERKKSDKLGSKYTRGIPIEIVPMALPTILFNIQNMWKDATVKLRMATPTDKAGPVVTDNGNLILDCQMGPIDDPVNVYRDIKLLTGVVDVGLFCNMAQVAYFGGIEDEKVDIWYK
ncbi:ribose 5-phosphate isomerase A-domain-containing protein [Phycomyces nitens]|nr:ribose 5-phosphate isomerase A-domain-containing protein [Phycomyces nitens]